ncbi:MAG: hypothetical protein K2K97_04975, partial [Muribaculaceae bacterium]|nr:hypothetical protein [Muribaculaceae bacterium]
IKKAVGSRFPSLANSLNHSKLKKRITMMYKEKSNAGRKLKALALVPALALAFGVSTLPSVRAAVATISYSELYASKDSENPANNKKTQAFTISQISNYDNTTTVVVEGRNLGNTLTVTGGTLNTNGNTCQANSMECQMTNGDAFITVNFPYSGEYKDTSMTLTINGQIVTLDLNHFLTAGKSYSSDPVDEIAPSSSLEGFTIYIDGKEVTASDLETLPSEKVESVDVDKKEKIISVTLK